MRVFRSLLALLLAASAATPGEIYPLAGAPIKGDIVRVTDKEVVYKQDGKEVTKPIKEVLKIDFRDLGKPPSDKPFSVVELTDGTQLHASKVLLKRKDLELQLLAGTEMKLPVSLVANVLLDTSKEAHRRDWKSRVFNTRGKEAVVVKRGESISSIECVLGEGDESGTAVNFAVTIAGDTTEGQRKLASLHGIIFKNTLGPKAMPMTCKLLDTLQDVVMVSSITPAGDGLTVTTPAGAKIQFKNEQIARLDYTPGKLDYLSDLEPAKVVVRSSLDEDEEKADQWHVYKDSNLEKKALSLGGVSYSKGLALTPYAELTYDLKGDYRSFEAVVGIDDGVSAAGSTVLVVEGDGKEMASVTISSEDKVRHRRLELNVKDVQKLRIVVKSADEFDTARHLDLADAKVRKE